MNPPLKSLRTIFAAQTLMLEDAAEKKIAARRLFIDEWQGRSESKHCPSRVSSIPDFKTSIQNANHGKCFVISPCAENHVSGLTLSNKGRGDDLSEKKAERREMPPFQFFQPLSCEEIRRREKQDRSK